MERTSPFTLHLPQNGLDPCSPRFRMRLPDGRPIPALHGFSRHIIPLPEDWPETAIVTGFWFLNQADDWNPSRSLTEFLSRGETPVYFGFGSIFGRDPKRVTQIILAGKPSIICPFFGDQPFWGRHVERLRVGPSPIPQKKLTVESLCHAIDTVMNDSTMRENAAVLGRSLRKENGTSNAVAFITQWMNDR